MFVCIHKYMFAFGGPIGTPQLKRKCHRFFILFAFLMCCCCCCSCCCCCVTRSMVANDRTRYENGS